MPVRLSDQKKFTEESIMPDELVRNMVDAASEKNAVNFKDFLDSSMSERIASALKDKKMEISNSMFKEDSKETQIGILNKKKKESALDQNDIAMKGTSQGKA